MEEEFLCDHPELRPFVLSDVQLTGTTIAPVHMCVCVCIPIRTNTLSTASIYVTLYAKRDHKSLECKQHKRHFRGVSVKYCFLAL